MKKFLSKLSGSVSKNDTDDLEAEEEYVELDTAEDGVSRVIVRPFTIEDFSDIKPVLDTLREGNTIVLVNIKPIKEKDLIELKRAINKLKSTCEAINGDMAGFGSEYIVITPSFAHIYRTTETKDLKQQE